jgi:hypothetical protein
MVKIWPTRSPRKCEKATQHQLDRHQDDDDVLAIEKNAEHPQREQDGGKSEIMRQADLDH